MELSRRTALGIGAAAAFGSVSAAPLDITDARETLPLWPSLPPGARANVPQLKIVDQGHDPHSPDRWISGIARPELVVNRPAHPNGAAMLIIPGGSYSFLAYDNEGTSQARWLNALGVTTFILAYRLPGEGWSNRADVPLQDAQRAMRLIRQQAARFGIDRERIAVLGFSAGGHLAGSIGTRHSETVYAPVDSADRLPARPALVGMIYPVVSLAADFSHGGSRDNLLGPGSRPDDRRRRSVENRIDADTPPIFLVHAADDGLVPVRNSLALYDALLAARRPGELHLFEEGGHGFGVRANPALPVAAWPHLFAAYSRRNGLLPQAAT